MGIVPVFGEDMFPASEDGFRRDEGKESGRIFGSREEGMDEIFFVDREITLDIMLNETASKTLDLEEEEREL